MVIGCAVSPMADIGGAVSKSGLIPKWPEKAGLRSRQSAHTMHGVHFGSLQIACVLQSKIACCNRTKTSRYKGKKSQFGVRP